MQREIRAGGGDEVVLVVDGHSYEERERGSVQVAVSGAPELNHAGPVGCRGQYFDSDNGPFDFRYTAHEAWLLLQLKRYYHFAEAPARRGGSLVWSARFGRDRVSVYVQCPLPRV